MKGPLQLSVSAEGEEVLLKQEEQTVFVEAGETVTLQAGSLLVSETENPELLTATPATSVSRTSAWRMCCVPSIRSLPAGR